MAKNTRLHLHRYLSIGKLMVYIICAGINPANVLPVQLDVGTNNQTLLDDPLYMGIKEARITGEAYDQFIEDFIQAVINRWPNVLLQFEDFAGHNANRILDKYRDRLCCFNDDIQGTAAVTVGTLLAACQLKNESLKDQTITFCGAGSAGCGIAEQIVLQMQAEGLSEEEARSRIFMINSRGLVTTHMERLKDFQARLTQPETLLEQWGIKGSTATLEETIIHSKSTVLIGVSAVKDLFTQTIVSRMLQNSERPIILPLSNPTAKSEATPADILQWTEGKSIVATGSPFAPVTINGETLSISQCNNSYIFPGIGLGVIASSAKRVTDNMLMASSHALAEFATQKSQLEPGCVLPSLEESREVSLFIAKAVYKQAIADGVALPTTDQQIDHLLEKNFWEPAYRHYRRTAF